MSAILNWQTISSTLFLSCNLSFFFSDSEIDWFCSRRVSLVSIWSSSSFTMSSNLWRLCTSRALSWSETLEDYSWELFSSIFSESYFSSLLIDTSSTDLFDLKLDHPKLFSPLGVFIYSSLGVFKFCSWKVLVRAILLKLWFNIFIPFTFSLSYFIYYRYYFKSWSIDSALCVYSSPSC